MCSGWAASGDGIGFEEVFCPVTAAFKDADLGVMQETVEERRGESGVLGEDLWPALE